jgi:hypothetical protein
MKSSAEFRRRPSKSSGFRLAANPFAIDQWELRLVCQIPSPLSPYKVGSRFRFTGVFCLALGSLRAPGSPGPCGTPWAAAIFSQLTLALEFA